MTRKQRGNVVIVLVALAVVWFIFFTLKGCIKDYKDRRDGHSGEQSSSESTDE